MWGSGKGRKVKGKSKSRFNRAGLQFPVGQIYRNLREQNITKRIPADVPVYLAAVMQYVATEILTLAGNAARNNNETRIMLRHLQLAICNNEEHKKLISELMAAKDDVLPNTEAEPLPKKT